MGYYAFSGLSVVLAISCISIFIGTMNFRWVLVAIIFATPELLWEMNIYRPPVNCADIQMKGCAP